MIPNHLFRRFKNCVSEGPWGPLRWGPSVFFEPKPEELLIIQADPTAKSKEEDADWRIHWLWELLKVETETSFHPLYFTKIKLVSIVMQTIFSVKTEWFAMRIGDKDLVTSTLNKKGKIQAPKPVHHEGKIVSGTRHEIEAFAKSQGKRVTFV